MLSWQIKGLAFDREGCLDPNKAAKATQNAIDGCLAGAREYILQNQLFGGICVVFMSCSTASIFPRARFSSCLRRLRLLCDEPVRHSQFVIHNSVILSSSYMSQIILRLMWYFYFRGCFDNFSLEVFF